MTQIKLRRDTSANFTSKNPILGVGEPAYETDTKKLKIGDGTTAYTQLEYFSSDLDKLNTSKMYKTGEISTDAQGYNQLAEMKHSTFDKSKFTVVGSPTITEDGVASGFSNSNYLRTNTTLKGNTFKIKCKFNLNLIQNNKALFGYLPTYDWGWFNYCVIETSNIFCPLQFTDKTNGQIVVKHSFIANKDYIVELEFTGTRYILSLYDSNGLINSNFYETNLKLYNYDNLSSYFTIGYVPNSNYNLSNGSIDLKQFSITVDDKEVFSGNKTGIDTIKANNYEVVGSPVISDDGVASGFSNSDYLRNNLPALGSKPFKIIAKVNTGDAGTGRFIYKLGTTEYRSVLLINESNNLAFWTIINDGNNTDITPQYFNIPANTDLFTKVEWDGSYYWVSISYDGKTWLDSTKRASTYPLVTYNQSGIFIGYIGSQAGSYGSYSIDLNSFKIYVDGNLVYQPCLKIPYTQSKTGSKIVDVTYRDRVIDLYEQEGQAGYYTIDEPNKNFTLPMGEIYGMIGQRSLISSTVTETNRVDIYSDKTCLICGNVTTAGTINLPIELANNNYFITLSTSAKTATSFTTTATGDYILIGKVA